MKHGVNGSQHSIII